MRVTFVAAILAVALLAGCADGGDSGPEDADFSDLGLTATEQTGILRGVVFDASITPIAGAEVTVTGPESRTGTTGMDGLFGFDSLAPGTYFVRAAKAGFLTAQQSAEVVANVQDPPVVKILLEVDPTSVAYVQSLKFEGFIECSFSLVAAGYAACSQAGVGNDEFIVEYTLDQPPTWVQSEMVWESTQAASDAMTLLYSYADGETVLLNNYGEASGSSPIVVTANETTAATVGLGAGTTLMIRVFNEPVEGTSPSDPVEGDDCVDRPALGGCLTGVGMTIQQAFTIYTHVFYGYAPPEGWLFSESGEPPSP